MGGKIIYMNMHMYVCMHVNVEIANPIYGHWHDTTHIAYSTTKEFCTFHVRCTNLHENQPDLKLRYSGTSCILRPINETFHASLPQIFA